MSAQQAVDVPSHLVIEFKSINFGERIAVGSCGPVFAGTLVTTEKVAIKELTGPEAMAACVRECGKHMMLHHRNIARLCGISQDEGKSHAYIITELAPGGSLADALKSHPQRNDWATLVRWALDIAYGVECLHSRSPPMLHLDLKPQNVLLFEDDTAKLCDFGIAHIMKHTVTRQTAMQFSPQYAAPEQFSTKPVSEAADIYGLGGVLFAMITKSEPWAGLDMFQICGGLYSGTPPSLPSPLPDQCPPALGAIAQCCLRIDPKQRSPLSQIINDLVLLHDELAAQPPSRIVTQHFARGPLPPAGWLSNVAAASSLLEILKLFESCPTPPGRSDIRFPAPTPDAIRAEYDRVASYIPRSKFNSDKEHEDAMAVGLYTDESFVYWLVNGWANDTSADQARGLRQVGPFVRRLIEALPRCCARYCGPAVRVLKAGQTSPQVMRDAFDDYERQFAEGTALHFCGFASFARGSKADDSFTRDFSIVLYCREVVAYDVDRYSMMRLARRRSEKEVLCLAPSAFRVSQPPTKTQRAVTVYTDMQATPEHPCPENLVTLNVVEHNVQGLAECRPCPSAEYDRGRLETGRSTAIINCCDPSAARRIQQALGLADALSLALDHPTDAHLNLLRDAKRQYHALAFMNAAACTPSALGEALAAATTVRYIAITGHRALDGSTLIPIVAGHPQLQSLNVAGCVKLTDASLMEIASKCAQLQSLNVAGCVKLTDSSLMEIAAKCSQLQSLNVCSCNQIMDASLMAIAAQCPKMQSLSLSGCDRLTDAGLMGIAKCSQLQSLNVWNCIRLTDASLMAIAAQCPKLQSLNLSGCDRLTDASLSEIAAKCTQLQLLDVSLCWNVSHASMREIATRCTKIQSLNVSWCDQLPDASLKEIVGMLTQLQSLNISRCKQLTDATLTEIAAKCTQLQSLDVTECEQLTDASLTELASKCKQLQSLNVWNCNQLTDASLKEIAAKCTQLQSLNVSWCRKLTDASLKDIAAKCQKMRFLNVSWCDQLTDASVKEIATKCTQLQSLNVTGCMKLTSASLKAIPQLQSGEENGRSYTSDACLTEIAAMRL